MNNPRYILDLFVLARYAEWAGDTSFCRELLKQLQEAAAAHSLEHSSCPEALVYRAALQIRDQLNRGENEDGGKDRIIDTEYMRGVIWRLGRNEFELRAYLKDLLWEENLYRRVQQVVERRGDATLHEQDDHTEERDNLPFQNNKIVAKGRGASWIIEGDDFFREVTVSDLALIVVRGIWTKHELPQNGLRIRELFEDVLTELKLEVQPSAKDQEPGV